MKRIAVTTVIAASLLIPATAPAGAGDPYFPKLGSDHYDVASYNVALGYNPRNGRIDATATIRGKTLRNVSELSFDLVRVRAGSATINGQPAAIRHSSSKLYLKAAPIAAETPFTVVIRYSGRPRAVFDGSSQYVGWLGNRNEVFVTSEPNGTRSWIPVNDHPSDKATYRFEITTDAKLTAVSNGKLESVVSAGPDLKRWTWVESSPMASYLATVAIGRYRLIEAKGTAKWSVLSAVPRNRVKQTRAGLRLIPRIVRFMEGRFGPYPFDTVGAIGVPFRLEYALETQTRPVFWAGHLKPRFSSLIAHELVHQWFGDSISPRTWKDIWLNEGFTTYGEWLWDSHRSGYSLRTIARSYYDVRRGLDRPPGNPGARHLFSISVYNRGALTLYALRQAVGAKTFNRILRTWIARHSGSSAGTDQFIDLAVEVSGRNVKPLLNRWLYSRRLPAFPR